MKIAIVHDWLNQKIGGAERVLLELAKLFPDADIYTLVYNPDKFGKLIAANRVTTSWLQKSPGWLKSHPRYLLPLIPRAVRSFNFTGYDIVISSSAAYAKNVDVPPNAVHICYCHTPMRFGWDYAEPYLREQRIGPLRTLAVKVIMDRIRKWDMLGASGVDIWLANSKTVARRIKAIYGQVAQVVYPPVDTTAYHSSANKSDFYVTLSMLTPYKKIDLVVDAFNASGRELKILGDGPEKKRLQNLAKSNIEFLGYVSDKDQRKLLAQAQALVFPNEEDFGIAPVEAMAAGTPVVAYARGGVTETVINQETGVLFDEQSVYALNKAIDRLESLPFNSRKVQQRAKLFDSRHFRKRLKVLVAAAARSIKPKASSIDIFGISVNRISQQAATKQIIRKARTKTSAAVYIAKPYVEHMDLALRDRGLAKLINEAWLVLPDGISIKWALHFLNGTKRRFSDLVASAWKIAFSPHQLGRILPAHSWATNFTWPLLQEAARQKLSIYIIGSPKQVPINQTQNYLKRHIPGLKIVGVTPGRDPATNLFSAKLQTEALASIKKTRPDIIFVALGFPLQEQVARKLASQTDHGVFIAEGGTFDFKEFGGHLRKAPQIFQRHNLEWLWRLLLEPKRLKRQLAIPRFMWRVYRQNK